MTKEDIIRLSDREFRDWLIRLSKLKRFDYMAYVSKIRLKKDNQELNN